MRADLDAVPRSAKRFLSSRWPAGRLFPGIDFLTRLKLPQRGGRRCVALAQLCHLALDLRLLVHQLRSKVARSLLGCAGALSKRGNSIWVACS